MVHGWEREKYFLKLVHLKGIITGLGRYIHQVSEYDRLSVCRFTQQMATVARVRQVQRQELESSFRSPIWIKRRKDLKHFLLHSQSISRKPDWKWSIWDMNQGPDGMLTLEA